MRDKIGGRFRPTRSNRSGRTRIFLMAQHDRRGLHVLVTLYAALALGWVAVAWWIVPSLLVRERPGPTLAALKWYIQNVPAAVPHPGHPRLLAENSRAPRADRSGPPSVHRSGPPARRRPIFDGGPTGSSRPWVAPLIMALAFLAVTVLTGPRHDYYLFLQIWAEVRLGHDPWFMSFGMNGMAPLNAYGPLFNLFAPGVGRPAGTQAPVRIRIRPVRDVADPEVHGEPSGRRPHVDRPDGLVLESVPLGRDRRSGPLRHPGRAVMPGGGPGVGAGAGHPAGIWLAAGVLLKYLPVVLVPFLALDRGRLRTRFLATALASIAMGMLLSCHVWGLSTLSPLTLAATRSSAALSIFRYIRSGYSPVAWAGIANYDFLSPILTVLALLRAWWWSWSRHPDIEAVAAVGSRPRCCSIKRVTRNTT